MGQALERRRDKTPANVKISVESEERANANASKLEDEKQTGIKTFFIFLAYSPFRALEHINLQVLLSEAVSKMKI